MVNSQGHVGTVSYLTTQFLGKPPGGSLPVLSTHSFEEGNYFSTKECAGHKRIDRRTAACKADTLSTKLPRSVDCQLLHSWYLISITVIIVSSFYIQTLFEPEKTGICICEIKDADQLRGYREADQRLCFRFVASTISLLPKSQISSL